MNPDPRPPRPPLLTLPPELLSLIISQTPYHAHHALRLTHRTFLPLLPASTLHTTLTNLLTTLHATERHGTPFPDWSLTLATHPSSTATPPNPCAYPTPRSHRNKHLLPPSHTPRHNPCSAPTLAATITTTIPTTTISLDLHPCSICLLFLPPWHFSARQSAAVSLWGARRRYCIDCAVAEGIWPVGTVVGGTAVVCARCGGFGLLRGMEDEKERGGRVESLPPSERLCGECVDAATREVRVGRAEGKGDGEGAHGEEEQEGQHAIAGSGSMRSDRCQRCWAIDHTERKPEQEVGGRPLCGMCCGLASKTSLVTESERLR